MADATGTSSSKAPDQLGHKGTESTGKEAELTADESRFVAELEFIQCLANPHYLAHLVSVSSQQACNAIYCFDFERVKTNLFLK